MTAAPQVRRMPSSDGPLVSVGMPVRNGGRWIRSTIETVLAQDHRDLELIISDNESTDATENICREIAAADPRVRTYRNAHNLGYNGSYNPVMERGKESNFNWPSTTYLVG